MKILKIGRSSTNDIVISDVTVSSQHAIITILDTKEVRIKDLNSTNGTYVNGKRIAIETTITASDVIKAGNSTVDWLKYLNERKKPTPPTFSGDASAIKQRKTIGRVTGNDIVFDHSDVSSNHAQLIEKGNGDIVIADSGSTNGTYVNGQKVSIQTLRPGDRVLIANKYPLDWQHIFNVQTPVPEPKKHLKIVLISAAAIAIVFGLFFLLKPPGEEKTWTPEQIYSHYKKSVVMVYGEYYYSVSAGNYDLGNFVIQNGELVRDRTNSYTGTGFFVSQDGKIVTNKHIAVPWAYQQAEIEQIKTEVQNYLKYLARQSRAAQIEYLPLVNEVKITGHLASIGIILNDTHLNNEKDIIPCHVLDANNNDEIDVAVIQTNTKTLPAGVENIVDLNKAIVDDADIVVGQPVYTIGFPAGVFLATTTQGLEANNQDGKITQLRGDYEFGHNIPIIGGASGSPVFNEYGNLIGVIHQGFSSSQGYNMAIKAKYAVELVK